MMRRMLCVLGLLIAAAPAATRAEIVYSFTTTLAIQDGPDTARLDGATLGIGFTIPTGAVYDGNSIGKPVVAVADPTFTISGSGVAANNGTFALEPLIFAPSVAGFFPTSGPYDFPSFNLGNGDLMVLVLNTIPTASGAAARPGDTVRPSDLAPSQPLLPDSFLTSFADNTDYNLTDTVITATAVPEPASLALLGGGALGLLGYARRRRAARA